MVRVNYKHSEETRKKMSASLMGHKQSDKVKTKISETMKGRYRDKETKRKIRDSSYLAWAERLGGVWYGNVRYADDRPIYCEKFSMSLKERVRAYRGYVCFECGTPQNGTKLDVHHVHYDKKMCCNGSPQDIIPLCHSCHTKTNHISKEKRQYWERHFTETIYNLDPTGKCFFTEKEMRAFQDLVS